MLLIWPSTIRASLAPNDYSLTLFLLKVKRRLECSRPSARARRKRPRGAKGVHESNNCQFCLRGPLVRKHWKSLPFQPDFGDFIETSCPSGAPLIPTNSGHHSLPSIMSGMRSNNMKVSPRPNIIVILWWELQILSRRPLPQFDREVVSCFILLSKDPDVLQVLK